MKRVYLCAPLGGEAANVREYARYVLSQGAAPLVPQIYAELLDLDDPKQRITALRAEKSLLWMCDECWVFGDTVTPAMAETIRFCKHLNIKVRCIKEMKLTGGNNEKSTNHA